MKLSYVIIWEYLNTSMFVVISHSSLAINIAINEKLAGIIVTVGSAPSDINVHGIWHEYITSVWTLAIRI